MLAALILSNRDWTLGKKQRQIMKGISSTGGIPPFNIETNSVSSNHR
jgi:hypothetical protein